MLPKDGRFSSGPARIRPEQVAALTKSTELGTSHRQHPVRARVQSIQEGLQALFSLPDGYEIVLGQGGATAFWPVIATSLAREKAAAAVFGEFGAKGASDVAAAPWLTTTAVEAMPGTLASVEHLPGYDAYMYPQNETSTGVISPLYRAQEPGSLTIVDATSIAGAAPVEWENVDAYYFSPQKCFGSEGGLWLAVLSPAAKARAFEVESMPGRYVPQILSLTKAIKQSAAHQTLNTPSISTLVLLDEQVRWMNESGGLEAMSAKALEGAQRVRTWAQQRPYASLFVENPALRSPVTTTVDFDEAVPLDEIVPALRKVGIYDIEGYRKLGRNQLRIPSFPNIETSDIDALLDTLQWVTERVVD